MKSFQKLISFAFAFSIIISCSKNEDVSPQNNIAVTGTINGKPFSAAAEVTDTGSGLYILLKDNTDQEIAFYVTGVVAGTYPFKDPTALDFSDQQHSVATIVSSNNLYLASDGSITISKGTDGKLQRSYSLTTAQLGGNTSGNFQGLAIQTVPIGQCLINTLCVSPACKLILNNIQYGKSNSLS